MRNLQFRLSDDVIYRCEISHDWQTLADALRLAYSYENNIREADEWQPIDTCPRDKFVLLYNRNGFFSYEETVTVGTFLQWEKTATHWMPVPKPPTDKE